MSDVFFRDLGLPKPAFHLEIGSGTHAEQTAGVMVAYERVCLDNQPDWIVVVGDVNSTVACALVGAKLCIPVVHLEAGLRSGDRTMPEEINRLVTDAISDVLWTPSSDADENLIREGIDRHKIELIGNIMIDSYAMLRERIEASDAKARHRLVHKDFALVTLHRPSNVDKDEQLSPIVEELIRVAQEILVVFVAHPRTIKSLQKFGHYERIAGSRDVLLLEPQPYVDFMNVVTGSTLVITDSGGLQEETTYLGIPCLTLRENTERPITISQGTNRLVRADQLGWSVREVIGDHWPKGSCPPLWDGNTAERAVRALAARI
jgi:UDP-N-acetylglucosamine 2-epimerase (non-hydrolysing)